jgi:Tfp pilus assembly protein PilF
MSSLHDRAKNLFLDALDRPAAERRAFLTAACGGDDELRREVESLLAFHEEEQREDPGYSGRQRTPGTGSSRNGVPFVPGDVLAGRYRMITRIGRGGMGDVWRADDLVLQTSVALKLLHSSDEDARARILNEVRLARQITHPAVCRVFDVGEVAGEVFFSMELVEGEDLATLLGRAGRLPPEKVIDIAHQLCEGLSAAHSQGVLHRDLKPANVLIDDEGLVRITDFGIAVTRSEEGPHALIGTPGYMAPEQLVLGAPLTEQTDLYALGLVLYELLVGHHPFKRSDGDGPPTPPSALIPGVDARLEQVILEALSPDPGDRPPSAMAMAARLPNAAILGGRRRLQSWLAAAAVAAIVGLVIVVAARLVPSRLGALTEQDTIVLADFLNSTGEPVFDRTLKVALAVALEQSPFLKVFPDQRVQEALRLMQRAPTDRVTRAIAREIARREQLKALLAGSIGSLGTNYVLALEAVNAETGDVMAREQVEIARKEDVLGALGGVAVRIREKLGESLASIQRFDVPLARATTPSLEALHAYSLALDEGRVVPRVEAIPHLQRAIELDPDFALAQALLSGVFSNTGRSSEAPPFSRRAFELRDRVSERERFFIAWRYYVDATQAWDKALDLARSWTATYPREAFAFNSLGIASAAFGEHEEGVEALREAIRVDPRFTIAYGNLAGSLIALNRFAEAKAVIREGADRRIVSITLRRMAYLLAFLDSDSAGMARELKAAEGMPEGPWASNWEARTLAFAGRLQASHQAFQAAVQVMLDSKLNEFAAQWTVEDAEFHAVAGQCPVARREVAAGLELSRDNFTLERASRALAFCDGERDVMRLSSELADRFPEAALTQRIHLPVAAAALAVRRREPARALSILDQVKPYDDAPSAELWPTYLRGLAYLQQKDGLAARAQFENIVNRRGKQLTSPLYALAHVGLARAAMLTGERETARQFYEAFLALWKDADASLEPIETARRELAELR